MFKDDEIKICGKNACIALWKKSPDYIVKVYLVEALTKEFTEFLKWCSARKIAYKVVENSDLEKLTSSTHHEGICVLAIEHYEVSEEEILSLLENDSCVLYLDSIENPYNMAAIIRSASHFGIKAILGRDSMPKVSAALARVAEGGLEDVAIFRSALSLGVLKQLKAKGYKIFSTSSHRGESLFKTEVTKKCVFILGNETSGVSPALSAIADKQIKIPGTGAVESLNVSVSASLMMAEYARRV